MSVVGARNAVVEAVVAIEVRTAHQTMHGDEFLDMTAALDRLILAAKIAGVEALSCEYGCKVDTDEDPAYYWDATTCPSHSAANEYREALKETLGT